MSPVLDTPGSRDLYQMRAPCKRCGSYLGRIEPRGGQNCVYCAGCDAFAYNAPKTETGEAPRSVTTRPGIKPSLRTRVLERDGNRCVACGATGTERHLHIGHQISVKQGHEIGMTDADLYDYWNLVTLCEECNAGQGERTLAPTLIWRAQQIWKAQTEGGRP